MTAFYYLIVVPTVAVLGATIVLQKAAVAFIPLFF